MRRSHIMPLAVASMAASAGTSASGDAAVVTVAEKQAADDMFLPRAAKSWRKSPGTIASKRRRNRRRGW
jgi:hypothetical protein